MGSVRTSILGRPRPLSRQRRACPPYTLISDEPSNRGPTIAPPLSITRFGSLARLDACAGDRLVGMIAPEPNWVFGGPVKWGYTLEEPLIVGPFKLAPDPNDERFIRFECTVNEQPPGDKEIPIVLAAALSSGFFGGPEPPRQDPPIARARVTDISRPSETPGLRRVSTTREIRYDVHGGPVPHSFDCASAAALATALLRDRSGAMLALWRAYVTGRRLEGTASNLAVVLYCTVLEHFTGGPSMKKVEELANALRDGGYAIPSNPSRNAARIRASVAHWKPEEEPPNDEEVRWFSRVSLAYLMRETLDPAPGR